MTLYINLSNNDAVRLNDLLFNKYVQDAEGNYIFPFQEGTTEYIDATQSVFVWSDLMEFALTDETILQADRDWLAELKLGAVTREDAITNDWIQAPSLLT